MMIPVSFGTSGHRGIVSKGFTARHVWAIAKAVAVLLKRNTPIPKVVIGYDCRPGNSPHVTDSFTFLAYTTLLAEGAYPLLFKSFSPTPLVSWTIQKQGLDGGLIFTASHNPPQYNGIKFNPSHGGPASTDITSEIQKLANSFLSNASLNPSVLPANPVIEWVDTEHDFAFELASKVKQYTSFSTFLATDTIVIDARHGSVASVWHKITQALSLNSHILNESPLSDFGGIEPNPTKKEVLSDLAKAVLEKKALLGVANDPDGDRHVIVDELGHFLSPEEVSIILAEYFLLSNRRLDGLGTTVASSMLIKTWAQLNGVNFEETRVGFKYFTPFFEKAKAADQWFFGVESSGGFSASWHTFEKCGFLPAVLLACVVKQSKKPLSVWRTLIQQKYGQWVFIEKEIALEGNLKDKLEVFFKQPNESVLQKALGPNLEFTNLDGLKINFLSGWALLRLSGTEPLARLYVEAASESEAAAWVAKMTEFVGKV